MKKYILFLLFLIITILTFNKKYETFAYICNNIISPSEVSTNNLEEYLVNNNIENVTSFCSYDYCYNIREGKHSIAIALGIGLVDATLR